MRKYSNQLMYLLLVIVYGIYVQVEYVISTADTLTEHIGQISGGFFTLSLVALIVYGLARLITKLMKLDPERANKISCNFAISAVLVFLLMINVGNDQFWNS
jgi:hypothetical protein